MLYLFSYITDYQSHYAQTNLLALQIIAKLIGRKTIIYRNYQVQTINNQQPTITIKAIKLDHIFITF